MKACPCDNRGILEDLIGFIDINDPDRHLVGIDPLITYKSNMSWADATHGDLSATRDYGLAQFDIGRSRRMYNIPIPYRDRGDKLFLSEIATNTYTGEQISGSTQPTVDELDTKRANIYSVSGSVIDGVDVLLLGDGYLHGFWKLDGFDHQVLPERYARGFTIDSRVYLPSGLTDDIAEDNDGFFFYLGARSENKFAVETCNELFTKTSEGNSLGQDHPDNLELGIEGNVIGFRVDEYGNIGYRLINERLEVKELYSCQPLEAGWNNITIWYRPNSDINDRSLLECDGRRYGTLRVYVNGNLVWEVPDFEEPRFKGMATTRDKQIGVPYTLSWGGGSFGLKHSWRFKESDQFYLKDIPVQRLEDIPKYQRGVSYCRQFPSLETCQFFGYDYIRARETCGDLLFYTPKIEFKSRHYYKVAVDYSFLNYTGDTSAVAELIEINADIDHVVVEDICETPPSGSTDNPTLSDLIHEGVPSPDVRPNRVESEGYEGGCSTGSTYTAEYWFLPTIECDFEDGQVSVSFPYEELDLELGEGIRIHNIEVEEIFYNYGCNTEYCSSGSTEGSEKCQDPFEGLTGNTCGQIYERVCELDNLLVEKYFDGNLKGAGLQKLRIYDRPLLLQEIRTNHRVDSEESGSLCPSEVLLDPSGAYTLGYSRGYLS